MKYLSGNGLAYFWSKIKPMITGLQGEVDALKKSVSDGKTKLATSITNKKVPTQSTDTFATMASNIDKIKLGSGNATTGDVISGKTFTNDTGTELTGTLTLSGNADANSVLSGLTFYNNDPKTKKTGVMTNRGSWGTTINPGSSVTIPSGYHNGSGVIRANGIPNITKIDLLTIQQESKGDISLPLQNCSSGVVILSYYAKETIPTYSLTVSSGSADIKTHINKHFSYYGVQVKYAIFTWENATRGTTLLINADNRDIVYAFGFKN